MDTLIRLTPRRSRKVGGVRLSSRVPISLAAIVVSTIGLAPAAAAGERGDIVVTARTTRPFNAPAVADPALARMRGGILLPGGLSIAIGIDIQTSVDKQLAVHTIYNTDGPDAGIRVFTGGSAPSGPPPGTVTLESDGTEAPSVVVSRSPTGTTVDLSAIQMPIKVNLLSDPPSAMDNATGEMQVPVIANGASVATRAGDISLVTDDRGAVVMLQTPTLMIQQIVGQANGVIVANAADGRMIDTVSSVNLDLHGLSPELASGLALSDQLALAVATNR